MAKTTVILNCGHEHDYTGEEDKLPKVGETHSCWSACDHVPTWRGGGNPHIRRVAKIRQEG
jgi:hypothetical protein